ncbi:ABC transporter ATP-binding protein [Lentilactobacillus kosonis]|uniref:Duplicated ATPase component YkoD of energizing module of thiamin-regulated ECF transporter for hydroxymethylpyrimidine n=1 Tax=Lentilactobacillus kosonis TaxID=2810561 RepID=A0A401FMJ1_9LACO|nr:ABC transporter ATP-binding protein [Lentilactobacillus kosonis]GAY73478.1 duplicated ATPase component YkoD of energizing module of thiamin-regulated ECF transporter for hydroxymethylpyrimidine [Lentilactobacillus kosonis]
MADVKITNFNFKYSEAGNWVLKDLNLTFPNGEFSLLSGPSGSGKTTLLKFIANLYPNFTSGKSSGTISFNGYDITTVSPAKKNQLVAMMFQNPNQQFAMNVVKDELVFVLENLQTNPTKMDTIIDNALEFVDISDLKARQISSLSGGQKQRVALASIIAMDADVIVLDEPFASIDFLSRIDLINKLKQLQTQFGKTIIIADHDLSSYDSIIDNFFFLNPDQHQIAKLDQTKIQQLFKQFANNEIEEIPVTLPNNEDDSIIGLQNFHLGPMIRCYWDLRNLNFINRKQPSLLGTTALVNQRYFRR